MSDEAFPAGFDRADWKAQPHLAWALRNVDRFLPTATIATAAPPECNRFGSRHLPGCRANGEEPSWLDYLDRTHTTSAIVVTKGSITDERYLLGAKPHDRHMLFSITKSIVGLLAAMLSHWGVIDEDREAADYVPELAGSAFGSARLGALLAMRDGVEFDERYADPDAAIHRYSRHYWGGASGGTLAALKALPTGSIEPGRFAYRTPVADVVALALQRASGRDLADLASDLLWRPMGAEADAALVLDTSGRAIGGTGLLARPRDLAGLGQLIAEGGMARGRRIIPAAVVDRLFAGGDAAALARAGYTGRGGWSYGSFWWHLGDGRIAAIGVHGQRLTIDREAGVVFARTGAAPQPDNTPFDALHAAAFDALVEA